MKLTSLQDPKTGKFGMTLLELTVVILVLLSLISILFVGARAWKKGSDRAASILQIRNVQQAVRAYSNMAGHTPGDIVSGLDTNIFGAEKFMETDPSLSAHPAGSGITYVFNDRSKVPNFGFLYMKSSDNAYNPTAGSYGNW